MQRSVADSENSKPKVAIIGAGFSGLLLANFLSDWAVCEVFEKARGVGGRMSTHYRDAFQFDHGAQFFTARSKAFQQFLAPHIERGLVKPWQPKKMVTLGDPKGTYKRLWFEPHYVACPKMNQLCKALASEQPLQLQRRIVSLVQCEDARWQLVDDQDQRLGPYDWVISSAPSPQTLALFPEAFSERSWIASREMVGCFSLMLGLTEAMPVTWEVAKVKASPIDWIAINASKPDRSDAVTVVVHATHVWAEQHMEREPDWVAETLKQTLSGLIEAPLPDIAYERLHRWRYANQKHWSEAGSVVGDESEDQPARQAQDEHTPYALDRDMKLAACGDWCFGGRVESAFLSAMALAEALKAEA